MMTRKGLLAVVVVLLAGIFFYNRMSTGPTDLVPAWSLLDLGSYRAIDVTDPFVTWSSDSKTIIFTESLVKTLRKIVFKWNVGDKKIAAITDGASPNFIDTDEFIYLKTLPPQGIFERNLKTGEEKEIMPKIKQSEFWKEVDGFTYVPEHKSLALRLATFTPRELPGTLEYDLNGKSLGQYDRLSGQGILDSSPSPKGDKCALIFDNGGNVPVLQIADKGKKRGKEIATGVFGAVAWSPDNKTIACGDGGDVVLFNADNGKRVVVGKFGSDTLAAKRSICRLKWSPNGKYLAAMIYHSMDSGDFPQIYVLDLSKFSWD